MGGFAAGAVQSGSLRGAVTGAVTAGVFYGIGGAFTPESAGWAYNASETMKVSGYAVRALSYGMAGGVMAQLQGGKFGHGFVSAGIGSFSPSSQGGRSMGKMVATAVIGGTATRLAGGKFGNGAVAAAFSYAFGAAADDYHKTGSAAGRDGEASVPEQILLEGSGFRTSDEAAIAAGGRYGQKGVARRQEMQAGLVEVSESDWGYLTPGWGPKGGTQVSFEKLLKAYRAAGFSPKRDAWSLGQCS